MDVIAGAGSLDTALEAAVVTSVRCIGDPQVVDSLVGPIINSARDEKCKIQ